MSHLSGSAVSAVQQTFRDTYGEAAYEEAITPPPSHPKVEDKPQVK